MIDSANLSKIQSKLPYWVNASAIMDIIPEIKGQLQSTSEDILIRALAIERCFTRRKLGISCYLINFNDRPIQNNRTLGKHLMAASSPDLTIHHTPRIHPLVVSLWLAVYRRK
jgi:hypothetical protein